MPGSGPASRWRHGTVQVSGGHLAYHRTGGDGPVLVLSHGLTDNGLCWLRFASAMAADFDVVMLDARGHGGSARPDIGQPWDPAQDLAEAIDGLALRRPLVMGHSVGGRATAAHANRHPGAVAAVILEDPAFAPAVDAAAAAARKATFRQQVERFRAMTEAEILALGRTSSPDWHEDDLPDWARAKLQVDAEALPVYATPWQEDIVRITAPTLVIHGEASRGSLMKPALIEDIRRLNPGIRTCAIPNAGHNVRRENFDAVLAAVRGFLLERPGGVLSQLATT